MSTRVARRHGACVAAGGGRGDPRRRLREPAADDGGAAQPTDPSYGPIIGDAKDARTRAKAHTELASLYYELGNSASRWRRRASRSPPTRAMRRRTTSRPGVHGAEGERRRRRELRARAPARAERPRHQPQLRLVPVPDRARAAVDQVLPAGDPQPALPDAVALVFRRGPVPAEAEPGGGGAVPRARAEARPEHASGDDAATRRSVPPRPARRGEGARRALQQARAGPTPSRCGSACASSASSAIAPRSRASPPSCAGATAIRAEYQSLLRGDFD